MIAVVMGMIATYPVGGVAFDYGTYARGLEQLGFEVYYVEDTGLPAYTWNASTGRFEEDPADGIRFLRESLAYFSSTLANRWHYRACDGRSFGMDAAAVERVMSRADVLLNVSGGNVLREAYRACPRKVYVDTDPGWNHFVIFPRQDAAPVERRAEGFRGHDHFFTFAGRIGEPDCPLDDFGLTWHSTRHPVLLDRWRPLPPGERYTTLMMWNNYGKPIDRGGVRYGSKEMEFDKVERLPRRVSASLEVAVNGEDAPRERWRDLGWSVVSGGGASRSAESYNAYVAGSRGELSVAKNVYVATRSGWFSGRSACYLAAGRPAVVQETGFSEQVPVGRGVLSFADEDGAAAALAAVEADYVSHCRTAREIAAAYFDARLVLGGMLKTIGMG